MRKLILAATAATTLITPAIASANLNAHGPAKVPVHACVAKRGHKARLAKHCTRNERGITIWLKAIPGPQGPQGVQGPAGTNGTNATNGTVGTESINGNITGLQGPQGPKGDTGLAGAFWSVQNYPGGIGAGGIATVACVANSDSDPLQLASQQYVAIAGGVEPMGPSTDMSTTNPLPIAASFPGRMDWSGSVTGTPNSPKPGRLDGWIIQTSHANAIDTPASVWALCVPKANIGPTVVN